MIVRAALALAALLLAAPAMAQIYKCPDANGRTVIQQVPCMGGKAMNVRPASGHDPARAPVPAPADAAVGGGAAAAKPMTEAERINARTEASQRDRRRDELQNRGVPSADAAIGATRRNCRAEMARLEADRGTANNNLAGATYLQSLATQEQALQMRCAAEERTRRDDYQRLLAECKSLGGCKNFN